MELENFIQYAFKAKSFTQKSIKDVSEMPLDKIVIGTTVIVLPGGIVIGGVYIAAQELKKRYRVYVEDMIKKNEKPEPLISWLNNNYADHLKEKKDKVIISVNYSVVNYGTKLKNFTVGKVNYLLKRK
ncbi:hypothetical protein GW820_06145 [archaeon]|nr:hypothetical protein [archaeon]